MNTASNILSLNDLGIRVWNGMRVYWPQSQQTEVLSLGSYEKKSYSGNNGVIVWTNENGETYVGVYTRQLISLLKNAGFQDRNSSQYVPFSNWDYPLGMKDKWDSLWEMAKRQRELEFKEDCIAYSEKNGFGILPDEFLAKCFPIPRNGLEVQYLWGDKDLIEPAIRASSFDCTVTGQLGRYDYNNGRTSFVYHDGTQYVIRGYHVDELKKAGYCIRGLFVPFSNGEIPAKEPLRSMWERLVS